MGITQLYIIQPLEANFSPQTETETGSFQSGVWGILFFFALRLGRAGTRQRDNGVIWMTSNAELRLQNAEWYTRRENGTWQKGQTKRHGQRLWHLVCPTVTFRQAWWIFYFTGVLTGWKYISLWIVNYKNQASCGTLDFCVFVWHDNDR